ncbi:CopG domain protein DNA-binding domain protein [Nitrosococcus halophilus Nc 4]|uniref:CopG domain protein DNA-binding domain protein n=1 Tax=Nitrosococcus halophilus (strain Nc4) TaxID=472759 RepID=D5BXX3_NITHN|nr:CopG domain protein DNA-binding domain protein [Nitrosococcus halophilus Nc 4]
MAREYLNVRVDADLKKQLQKLAKRENRTLSNLVETVLGNYAKRKSS